MKLFKQVAVTVLGLGISLIGLSGCSVSVEGNDYKAVQPAFDLEQFFDGDVKAWGIVQNRSGEVVQRFIVDIAGKVEGDTLTLDEKFEYGVGEGPTERVWTIVKQSDNTFIGSATDIEGPAKGTSYGNAFNFHYEMDLPVDDTTYAVTFDDWFWAFDENTMMNRSYIRKFGIVMAEVTIFMQKQ
ncbi:MAG: DUF3833 domain-containing protein [Pseudomonadota bacterium]|uniref:DUF3833 domain-containing protein n=1 Tax=Alteromonas sp. MTD1 TaxID=3057962 RepID=UPI002EC54EAF|nr:DUF3833 domain-containing protein [Pseudomonadota bacterium]MEC8419257.1 DUF3833 domain-containing protein [Pseudomonadota bacterium]